MKIFSIDRLRNLLAPLLTTSLFFCVPANVHAQIVTLGSTIHDTYRDNGTFSGVGNYACGDPVSATIAENRAFFVFDLGPNTNTITAATLRVFNPVGGFGSDQGPTEDLTIFDVSTPIASLIAGTGGVAAFNDLGSGTAFATRTCSTADNNMIFDINLNAAAVAALNSSSGQFAFGGAITTLASGFINQQEEIFRFTEGGRVVELVLVTVPEPSSLLLSCIGLAAAAIRHRRRRVLATTI